MTCRTAVLGVVSLGLLAVGCGAPEPDRALFEKAEQLYRDGQFQNAIPVLKSYLLTDPDHSGAHLYLGSCYCLGGQWMTFARGEIETALTLYERDGKKSTIERFPDEYFELRCYLELAKITMIQADVALQNPGVVPGGPQKYLRELERIIAKAKEIAPDSADVKNLEELTRGYRPGSPSPVPQRVPPAEPGTVI